MECDEEEMLTHTRELLAELNSGEDGREEDSEDGREDGREDRECRQEMDVT